MPNISATEAAIDAVVTHLGTEVSSASKVLRGWPEHPESLDLGDGPVIAVVWQQPARAECSPRIVESIAPEDDADPTTYLYRVAWLTIPAQVEVFAPYRAQLDDAGLAVQQALHNRLPNAPGLLLTSTSYYDRSVTGTCTGERSDADSVSAERGEFRKTIFLELQTDEVVATTHPRLTRLDLALTVEAGGSETTTSTTLAEV